MAERVKVVPRPGVMVRDPESMQLLPKDGLTVELTNFWRRRINDGSVAIQEEPAPQKPAEAGKRRDK